MKTIHSYLTFKIGSEYYAADVTSVQNIIEYTKVTKIPQAPEYVLGVIDLRGIVLPVVDSRIKFNISDRTIDAKTCILVIETHQDEKINYTGMLVDEVSEVLEINNDDIKEPPSLGLTIDNRFIQGVYHDNEKFIVLLDITRVIDSEALMHATTG